MEIYFTYHILHLFTVYNSTFLNIQRHVHWKLCCRVSISGGDHPFSCWQVDFIRQLPLWEIPASPATMCVNTLKGWLLAPITRDTTSEQVTLFQVYLVSIWPSWHCWPRSKISFYHAYKIALGFPAGYPVELSSFHMGLWHYWTAQWSSKTLAV